MALKALDVLRHPIVHGWTSTSMTSWPRQGHKFRADEAHASRRNAPLIAVDGIDRQSKEVALLAKDHPDVPISKINRGLFVWVARALLESGTQGPWEYYYFYY